MTAIQEEKLKLEEELDTTKQKKDEEWLEVQERLAIAKQEKEDLRMEMENTLLEFQMEDGLIEDLVEASQTIVLKEDLLNIQIQLLMKMVI